MGAGRGGGALGRPCERPEGRTGPRPRLPPSAQSRRPRSEAAAHLRIALGPALNAFSRWRGATDPPPDTGSAKGAREASVTPAVPASARTDVPVKPSGELQRTSLAALPAPEGPCWVALACFWGARAGRRRHGARRTPLLAPLAGLRLQVWGSEGALNQQETSLPASLCDLRQVPSPLWAGFVGRPTHFRLK